MTISTRIDGAKGVGSTNNANGTTIERDSGNKGFAPFQVDSQATFTTSSNVGAGDAGLCVVSGNVVHTLTMVSASDVPNAEYVFRTTSAHAHILTGSNNTFVGTGSSGTRLALSGTVGSSVVIKSDGNAFIVLGFRNPPTIS